MRARDESPDLGGSIHSPSCSKTEAEEQNGRSEVRDGVWRSAREQFLWSQPRNGAVWLCDALARG